MLDKIRNLGKKRLIGIIIGVIILIGLPITIFSVRNRINIASNANNPVTVTLSPLSKTISVNQSADIQVILKAGTISVQAVEFSISYGNPGQDDPINVEFIPNPNSGFTALYTPPVEINTSAKTINYKTAVSIAASPITGDIVLGTLSVKGLRTGTGQINFTNGKFHELSGELTPTFQNGTYEIINQAITPTSTPTSTPTPTSSQQAGTIQLTNLNASNVTSNQATLRGTVFPSNKPFSVWFAYSTVLGECNSLILKTSATNYTTNLNSLKTINKALTNLAPNTNYYYCIAAKDTSSNITYYALNVITFKTSGADNSPTATLTQRPPSTTITNGPTATNTSIPSPTTTLASNEAAISINVKLPGVGNNNNNQNPRLGENNNPSPKRNFSVLLYDPDDHLVGTFPTEFTYSNGLYRGTTRINNIPFTKPYTIKLKADNSLQSSIGVAQLTPGQNLSMDAIIPGKQPIMGKVDSTNPNVLGVPDYTLFMSCFKNDAACTANIKKLADFNDDGKIDLKDYNIIISSYANVYGD